MLTAPSFQILSTAIGAALIAQLLKFIGYLIINKKINFKMLTTTGGMPSSHTAGMVGLSVYVALLKGYSSVEFAIAAGVALVVMQDAAGLRRSAGKIAASLNKMMDDFYLHKPTDPALRLKELLGHTPIEVVVGAILGIFIAYFNHLYLF